jgi:hypothetical protein
MLYFHSVLGQVSWQATPRLRFTLGDAFTHNDQPREADSLGLRRQRGTFTSNELSVAADYKIDRVDTRAYYRWNTFSNTSDGSSTGNTGSNSSGSDSTTTQIAGISAAIPLYVDNTLTLGYEYVNSHTTGLSDQTSQTNSQGSQNQDVSGHQLTAALGRKINSRLTAGVSGSYAFRDVSGGGDSSGASNFRSGYFAIHLRTDSLTVSGRSASTADSTRRSRGPSLSLSHQPAMRLPRRWSRSPSSTDSRTFATGRISAWWKRRAPPPRSRITSAANDRDGEPTTADRDDRHRRRRNIAEATSMARETTSRGARYRAVPLLTLDLTHLHELLDTGSTDRHDNDNANGAYTAPRRISLDFTF